MKSKPSPWAEGLGKYLPTREFLAAHPWLKPVANHLLNPQLWRLQHEAVARGVAVGTFWAFAMPVAQMVVASAHCVWWRANIPAAAAMTMITNPLTIGFWLWLAYQLGAFILGAPVAVVTPVGASTASWLATYGWPTILGMALFAAGGSALAYLVAKAVWRTRVWLKRRPRR